MDRSAYLGVYNLTEEQRGKARTEGATYRVAIKFKDRKSGEFKWFNVNDWFVDEHAAARVYNAYAIKFFGKGAILNDIPEECAMNAYPEVSAYFDAKPNRQEVMASVVERMTKLREEGHVWRTNVELHAQQAAV